MDKIALNKTTYMFLKNSLNVCCLAGSKPVADSFNPIYKIAGVDPNKTKTSAYNLRDTIIYVWNIHRN